jgi:hypothetical protein
LTTYQKYLLNVDDQFCEGMGSTGVHKFKVLTAKWPKPPAKSMMHIKKTSKHQKTENPSLPFTHPVSYVRSGLLGPGSPSQNSTQWGSLRVTIHAHRHALQQIDNTSSAFMATLRRAGTTGLASLKGRKACPRVEVILVVGAAGRAVIVSEAMLSDIWI